MCVRECVLPLAKPVRTFPKYETLYVGSSAVIVADPLFHIFLKPTLNVLIVFSLKSKSSSHKKGISP